MKKLIAISVILVLLASVAFAETTVSATVMVKADLLSGTTREVIPGTLAATDPGYVAVPPGFEFPWYQTDFEHPNYTSDGGTNYKGVFTSFQFSRLRLNVDTSNDEGTFGGRLRYEAGGGASGFGWWKPIEVLKVQLGQDTDYPFGVDNIVGWNFYEAANDVGFSPATYGYNGMFGGWGAAGLILAVTPIDPLAINIMVPLGKSAAGGSWTGLAEYVYKSTTAQVTYNIDGIGKVAVTYAGGIGDAEWEAGEVSKAGKSTTSGNTTETELGVSAIASKPEVNDPAKVYLSFDLSAIENLGLNFGVAYKFGYEKTGNGTISADPADPDKTVKNPNLDKSNNYTQDGVLSVALGAKYDVTDEFGVKVRVGADLLGDRSNSYPDTTVTTTKYEDKVTAPLTLGADIMPYYALSDAFKVYLSIGVAFTGAQERTLKETYTGGSSTDTDKLNSTLDWHVQPYITYSAGPGTFYAGFNLNSKGERSYENTSETTGSTTTTNKGVLAKSYINWSVPIGFNISF